MSAYESAEARLLLARTLAQEAIVLLKNEDGFLPLKKGTKAAVIGRTSVEPIIGGSGSGTSFSAGTLKLSEEFTKAGIITEPGFDAFYKKLLEKNEEDQKNKAAEMSDMMEHLKGLVASGAIYEIFGRYTPTKEEPVPDDSVFTKAAGFTDTAIFVIGRSSGGEECDRHVDNDYYLTPTEKMLIEKTAGTFKKIIVIFNVNGAVDTSWMKQYPQIKAAFFMGTPGEQGAGAMADLMIGKAVPSGHMSQTLALSYEDYPTSRNFSSDKDKKLLTYEDYGLSAEENGSTGFDISPVTVYQEGIYSGYRYFDTFKKEVMYPFGHGLSYTSFEKTFDRADLRDGKLILSVSVTNTGKTFAGKETVLIYVSLPSGNLDQPEKKLAAFQKTELLKPGEKTELEIVTDLNELASFDENSCAYVVEPGFITVFIGGDPMQALPVLTLEVKEHITVRQLKADIGLKKENREKINILKAPSKNAAAVNTSLIFPINKKDFIPEEPLPAGYDYSEEAKPSVLSDVREGKVSAEAFLNQMSVRELAVLANGYGPGLPFSGIGQEAPSTIYYEDGSPIGEGTHKTANMGYMNPSLKKYGIYSAFYKDGPASVGKTAWPTGMMLSCTFNEKLLYEFGSACGWEAESLDVDSWLGPGMNLIRNPIEGRAFEYFSEDPYLAGRMGVSVAKGAMENNNVTVCPKHFALNEQETYRRGSAKKNIDAVDSIADARTVRELYLKPFEMVIREAKPRTIMTSFNKINGVFAAGSHALNTEILREEWGYTGVVVTDWGDMDIVVDGADAVAAGNDVVMPGGPPVIAQVLKGYEEGRVNEEELKNAVGHLMNFVMESKSQKMKEDE